MRNALGHELSWYGLTQTDVLIRHNTMPGKDKIWVQVTEDSGVFVEPGSFAQLADELAESFERDLTSLEDAVRGNES